MLSTAKDKYSLISELYESSITSIFIVCVWQKNLLAYCGELLEELVSFSVT